jgi:uncharacterized RDD family membrane protein YckC
MKCPKCQYISFGRDSRCRNCGYDFSLVEEAPALDLPIKPGNPPIGPLADLPLAPEQPYARGKPELPLFSGSTGADDAPLVSAPAVPRPPLAVRRGAPAMPKSRSKPADNGAKPELDLEEPISPPGRRHEPQVGAEGPLNAISAPQTGQTAPVLNRIGAALLDVLILAAIDAAVLYLTLRLTSVPLTDVMSLPEVPLAAFLLLLNGGYFVLFTAAGGQTIGKMATGIRVVPHEPSRRGERVPFNTAVLRAVAYAASLLPVGLGFLPILFRQDRRALHDRLSDTRVVKA